MSDNDLRFPIGKFDRPAAPLDAAARASCIDAIEAVPAGLRVLVQPLTGEQLERRYRPGGWTIRQVVHHVPESHMNAYIRFKLAVTEDAPTIKPYMEARWAELPDAHTASVALSLDLLDALHRRWTVVLRQMSASDFDRVYVHPEMGAVPLYAALALYTWHGQHHMAHVRNALQ